ncbi:MAG: YdeI/OmpD-associated family protein [Pirellulaceae bacterium]
MSSRSGNNVHKGCQVIAFATQSQWLKWLDKNQDQEEAIWIKFAKKKSGIKSITYEEAREVAIMYGWIDGLLNSVDEQYFLRRFSPRRPRSLWSKINREIAVELIESGKMQPRGLAEVDVARQDGRWAAAYGGQSSREMPPELKAFLDKNPKAREFFDSVSAANRYAFIGKIVIPKTEATKQRWLKRVQEMLLTGEVFYPALRKKK